MGGVWWRRTQAGRLAQRWQCAVEEDEEVAQLALGRPWKGAKG